MVALADPHMHMHDNSSQEPLEEGSVHTRLKARVTLQLPQWPTHYARNKQVAAFCCNMLRLAHRAWSQVLQGPLILQVQAASSSTQLYYASSSSGRLDGTAEASTSYPGSGLSPSTVTEWPFRNSEPALQEPQQHYWQTRFPGPLQEESAPQLCATPKKKVGQQLC